MKYRIFKLQNVNCRRFFFSFIFIANLTTTKTTKKKQKKKVLDYRRHHHRLYPATIRKVTKVLNIQIHRCHRMYSSNYCKINRNRLQLAQTVVVHRPCNKIVIQIRAMVAMETVTPHHHQQHRHVAITDPVQDNQFTHH